MAFPLRYCFRRIFYTLLIRAERCGLQSRGTLRMPKSLMSSYHERFRAVRDFIVFMTTTLNERMILMGSGNGGSNRRFEVGR